MIELCKYNPEYQEQWNALVESSKNGIFLVHRNYMDYHKDRFIDHSIVLIKGKKIMAVFPATENGSQIISHGGLTFGSLIMSFDVKAVEIFEALNQVKYYYKALGFSEIIYKAVPSIFHKYPSEEDLYALFRLDAKLVRRDISSVVKIKNKIRFSESKRQAVTKCEKLEVKIIENNNFDEYWCLLTDVLSKFGTSPVHSLEEINKLKKLFPTQIRLFEARKDDVLLAGIVIYDYGNVVHTQYMANSQYGRKIGALDFINQKLIEDVFNDREYYSFGISTENQGMYLNEGLIQQKEMMGSRGISIDFYSIALN
ncbi:GNAT family N-acetyltransferase [Flavobacterium degerlachei]|jgi:hypothetical protein|uniref:Acetyltransferase (GNAT) domain-containing protein n=1 Tax=Flavobacterium degerlachei TaxID=229203 RepID=A0A1H2VQ24_9FLAO|nr:GNAT family N-acetyltransferase [Flavobacterium degerlachei]SDW70368.1 Acetyltransferase (GNAT) domain-containing protein [Flavobacterium degerlachei]